MCLLDESGPGRRVIRLPAEGASFGSKLDAWDIYAFSVAGTSHMKKGLLSDDVCSMHEVGPWIVAIASDGAGSAKFGAHGAKLLADQLSNAIAKRLTDGNAPKEINEQHRAEWRDLIEEDIENVRSSLIKNNVTEFDPDQHEIMVETLRDYHATLVGVVSNGQAGMFFHIGDGLGVAFESIRSPDDSPSLPILPSQLSLPENGEYANQTFFFTMQNWRQHLRLTFFGQASDVVIMTDGIANLILTRENTLYDQTIQPILRFLPTVVPEQAALALLNSFTCDEANLLSGDDKTLVWLSRQAST